MSPAFLARTIVPVAHSLNAASPRLSNRSDTPACPITSPVAGCCAGHPVDPEFSSFPPVLSVSTCGVCGGLCGYRGPETKNLRPSAKSADSSFSDSPGIDWVRAIAPLHLPSVNAASPRDPFRMRSRDEEEEESADFADSRRFSRIAMRGLGRFGRGCCAGVPNLSVANPGGLSGFESGGASFPLPTSSATGLGSRNGVQILSS